MTSSEPPRVPPRLPPRVPPARRVEIFVPKATPTLTSDGLNDLFRSIGPGGVIQLMPNTIYRLNHPIRFAHPHQELSTYSYPSTSSCHQATLIVCGRDQSVAIDCTRIDFSTIRNLTVEGNREDLGWIKGGGALILVGAPKTLEPTVQDCILRNPRGWSCMHVCDFCEGAKILNNVVGPAGLPAPDGPWADGLSIACKNGLIMGNTITDATDGGIVIFCAPGTLVVSNTIISRTRIMLGAINLVDPFPYKSDYTNTRVLNNHIWTDNLPTSYIKLGIGIGQSCWGDGHEAKNFGGTVSGNLIGPGKFGYGIAAAACEDFTVLNNVINDETDFFGDLKRMATNCPPVPFLKSWDRDWAQGVFQSEFVKGPVRFLIGVVPGISKSLRFPIGALGCEVQVEGGWMGIQDGELVLMNVKGSKDEKEGEENESDKGVIWKTNVGNIGKTWQLEKGGVLTVRDKEGNVVWDSFREIFGRERGQIREGEDEGRETVEVMKGIIAVRDGNENVTWMNKYVFPIGWRLNAGQWIAISPTCSILANDETSTCSSNPTFLTLLQDGYLTLHTSLDPLEPTEESTIWRSKNWKRTNEGECFVVLQGDGNMVIYKGNHALWASCTNGGEGGDKVKELHVGREGLKLVTLSEGERWKSC